jgi:hypothetical protein
MKRQFTCAYANCQKTDVPITLSMPDERSRFCCADHAAVAMVRRAWIATHGKKADELAVIERALRNIVGDGADIKK